MIDCTEIFLEIIEFIAETGLFLLIGGFAGFSSGMLGIGGGVIFVPALYFLLPLVGVAEAVIPSTAIATSLFSGSFSAASSAYNHIISKNCEIKKAFFLASGSVISATIIPRLVVTLNPDILKTVLVIVLFFVAIKLLTSNHNNEAVYVLKDIYLIVVGLIVGTLSAFCGMGGGVILVPALIYFTNIGMKKSVGTSALVVAITMSTATINYAMLSIDKTGLSESIIKYSVGIPFAFGAFWGARIGVKYVNKFSTSTLKKIFSVFLLFMIFSMVYKIYF